MLNISVAYEDTRVPVTVMKLEGELDAATYQSVLDSVRRLVDEGTRNMLLDLAELTYLGSSGLFVIHSAAMMLRGEEPPDPEGGWGAVHRVEGRAREEVEFLKLLDPQPQVERVLERSGLTRFFATYTDRSAALESF